MPPTSSQHFSLCSAGSYHYSPTPLHQAGKISKQRRGAVDVTHSSSREEAVLAPLSWACWQGWLSSSCLSPGGLRLCLDFSGWRSCCPPPHAWGQPANASGTVIRQQAAACHPAKAVGQAEGLLLSPHLRHLLQSVCGFSICGRNHLTALEMVTNTYASTPTESTEGTEGGSGGMVQGQAFCGPLPSTATKPLLWGLVFILTP